MSSAKKTTNRLAGIVERSLKMEIQKSKTAGRIGFIGMVLGLFVLCLLVPPEYAHAAGNTYYVSTDGDDTNSGLPLDQAWRTIDYAVDHVSAGDVIYVVPGNYGAEHVTITTSGTASNPIKITRYGTSGMITLKHDVEKSGNGIDTDGNYWIIEYFDISDYSYNVWIAGDHNTLNFCETHGNSNMGFIVWGNSGYNVFNECVGHDIENGFRLCGDYNLIKDCVVSGIIGHFCISIDHPGGTAVDNVLDGGDYSGTISDTAIAMRRASGTIIRNVEVHNCKDGIRTYTDNVNTTITNCYIHDMECESAPPRDGIAMGGNGIVSNNVIRNWGPNLFGIQATGHQDIIFSGNDMQGPSPEYIFRGLCQDNIIIDQVADSFEIVTKEKDGLLPTIEIEYTNGRVFKENSGTYTSHYYPEKSSLTLIGAEWVHWFITAYNMTASPASGSATVTVDKFDTRLPQGKILVDFTANTTNGNNVVFTVGELTPGKNYLVKRDGVDFVTKQVDLSGYIQFSNSEWSARRFTIAMVSAKTITASGNTGK